MPLVHIQEESEALGQCRQLANKGSYAVYADASCRNGLAGIGVVQQSGQRSTLLQEASIGRQSTCSVLATELIAIRQALKLGEGSSFFTNSTKALTAI